jgi:hypothetical protein
MMALVDQGIVASQPDAADRKPSIAVALRYAGFLQEQNRAAAGAEKHELRGGGFFRAVLRVSDFEPPVDAVATDVGHAMAIVDREASAPCEMVEQVAGQRPVVHVGAGDHPGRRDLLAGWAPFHHERNPLGQRPLVLGELHSSVERVRSEGGMSFLEKADIRRAPHEAHMRHRMDERSRGHDPLAHQVGPELARQIELDVDLQRLGNVDAAVGPLRRIVELAQRRVAGAGIIPGIRALERGALESLEDFDTQRRFELLEKRRKRRAHDARTDENDIRIRATKSVHVPLRCRFGSPQSKPAASVAVPRRTARGGQPGPKVQTKHFRRTTEPRQVRPDDVPFPWKRHDLDKPAVEDARSRRRPTIHAASWRDGSRGALVYPRRGPSVLSIGGVFRIDGAETFP